MNFTEKDFPSLCPQAIKPSPTHLWDGYGRMTDDSSCTYGDPYAGMTKSQEKREKKKKRDQRKKTSN